MRKKMTIIPKPMYSILMGILMGIVITSGFIVVITNIDKFFFNSFFGLNNDLLYYIGTFIMIPTFGMVYVYKQRILICENSIIINEKVFSNIKTTIQIDSIQKILFYEEPKKKKTREGIMILSQEESISILYRVYSKTAIKKIIQTLLGKNSQIEVDEYINKLLKQ